MATYAIGDVHGCEKSLSALIEKINPLPKDTLWFCGDIVNRGPSSLNCIKLIRSLSNKTVCVLGNHDIYLLAIASGVIKPPKDNFSLDEVLNSNESNELIDWLRHLPLIHQVKNNILVHAGLLPYWKPENVVNLAKEVSQKLQSNHWKDFLFDIWGNNPTQWSDDLSKKDKYNLLVNGLTRVRFVKSNGEIDFSKKTSPSFHNNKLIPWFSHPSRMSKKYKIIFGHWSSLGLIIRQNLISLDTGCVWGGLLTAARIEDNKIYSQVLIDKVKIKESPSSLL